MNFSLFLGFFHIVAGICLFFIGMNFFTLSLGDVLKRRKIVQTKLDKFGRLGFFVGGVLSTAVIQSSDASVILSMSLADDGVLEKSKALAFSFGARLGTMFTILLASLQETGLSSLLMSIALVIALFCSKKRPNVKSALLGFALFFLGLHFLKEGVLSSETIISPIFAKTGNSFLLFFIGLLFTALIQSSSATSSILVILTASGILNFYSSIFLFLGATVGTTATPLIASMKTKEKGKFIALAFSLSALLTALCALVICHFARENVDLFLTKTPQSLRLAVFGILYSFFSSVLSLIMQKPLEFSVEKLTERKMKRNA